jgi:hypothetical protein
MILLWRPFRAARWSGQIPVLLDHAALIAGVRNLCPARSSIKSGRLSQQRNEPAEVAAKNHTAIFSTQSSSEKANRLEVITERQH